MRGSRKSPHGVVAYVLALVAAWAAPSGTARAAGARADCISTPHEYLTAWTNRQVRCVSPLLFATAHDRSGTTPYPSGFWYAWGASSTNLERYLVLRKTYGDDPPKVGIGILSCVGIPGLESYDTPTDLAVYTLPLAPRSRCRASRRGSASSPREFGDTRAYPLAAQVSLVLAYSRLRPSEDVVGAFQAVTGCRRAALLAGEDVSPKIGCKQVLPGRDHGRRPLALHHRRVEGVL